MKTSRTIPDRVQPPRAESTAARESTEDAHTGTLDAPGAAERHRRIAERAYLRAAARGFAGDQALDDWLAAEQEIDAGTAASR